MARMIASQPRHRPPPPLPSHGGSTSSSSALPTLPSSRARPRNNSREKSRLVAADRENSLGRASCPNGSTTTTTRMPRSLGPSTKDNYQQRTKETLSSLLRPEEDDDDDNDDYNHSLKYTMRKHDGGRVPKTKKKSNHHSAHPGSFLQSHPRDLSSETQDLLRFIDQFTFTSNNSMNSSSSVKSARSMSHPNKNQPLSSSSPLVSKRNVRTVTTAGGGGGGGVKIATVSSSSSSSSSSDDNDNNNDILLNLSGSSTVTQPFHQKKGGTAPKAAPHTTNKARSSLLLPGTACGLTTTATSVSSASRHRQPYSFYPATSRDHDDPLSTASSGDRHVTFYNDTIHWKKPAQGTPSKRRLAGGSSSSRRDRSLLDPHSSEYESLYEDEDDDKSGVQGNHNTNDEDDDDDDDDDDQLLYNHHANIDQVEAEVASVRAWAHDMRIAVKEWVHEQRRLLDGERDSLMERQRSYQQAVVVLEGRLRESQEQLQNFKDKYEGMSNHYQNVIQHQQACMDRLEAELAEAKRQQAAAMGVHGATGSGNRGNIQASNHPPRRSSSLERTPMVQTAPKATVRSTPAPISPPEEGNHDRYEKKHSDNNDEDQHSYSSTLSRQLSPRPEQTDHRLRLRGGGGEARYHYHHRPNDETHPYPPPQQQQQPPPSMQPTGDSNDDHRSNRRRRLRTMKEDGTQVIHYSNGARKEIHPDGDTIVIHFPNGDIQTDVQSNQTSAYYYAESGIIQSQEADGSTLIKFPNGQVERHYPEGRKVIHYPDGTTKKLVMDQYGNTTVEDRIVPPVKVR